MGKKNHKRMATHRNLIGYTDESGNTGMNLFDGNQPYFWTGTTIAAGNLHEQGAELAKKLTAKLGVSELHGNQLRFAGIGQIAQQLIEFIEQTDCIFLFTRIEKEHIPTICLAEMLFDSDYNKAVSPSHDLHMQFRRMLTVPIATCLLKSERRIFWQAYDTANAELFHRVLANIQLRISERVQDPRGKQLLLEAIGWALSNIEDVFIRPLKILDKPYPKEIPNLSHVHSPNVLAVLLLVDGLQSILVNQNIRVVSFYHDVQNEFAKSIKHTFEIIKNVHLPRNSIFFKKVETIPGNLEFSSSELSFGLQLTDVCLWIMTRAYDFKASADSEPCLPLFQTIAKRGIIKEYSYKQLVSETQRDYEMMMASPLSPEAEARGRRFQEEVERMRIKRMTGISGDRD